MPDVSHLTSRLSVLTGANQLFLMLVLLAVFLYGMSMGKTRALLSLLAIYAAFMLVVLFPFMKTLTALVSGGRGQALIPAAFFVLLYAGVLAVLHYSSLKGRMTLGELSLQKVILISLVQVGFLASILSYLIPKDALPSAARSVYDLLGTQRALFVWAVAALAILPFMKQGRE